MKKLRKKKKPSFQRKRELGNEATKAIYKTRNYNTAEYGKLFEIKQEMPEDVITYLYLLTLNSSTKKLFMIWNYSDIIYNKVLQKAKKEKKEF